MKSNKLNNEDLEKELLRKFIRALLAFHDIPSVKIANKLNVSPAYISMLLTGKRKNKKLLRKILLVILSTIQNSQQFLTNYTEKLLSDQQIKNQSVKNLTTELTEERNESRNTF